MPTNNGRRRGIVVIVFGEQPRSDHGIAGTSASPSTRSPFPPLPTVIHHMRWCCRIAAERDRNPVLLAPARWRDAEPGLTSVAGMAHVSWHEDGTPPALPETHHARDVWIVDGTRWDVCDWAGAKSATRPRHCDILLFGSSDAAGCEHYTESLHTDEFGNIVGFRRHYSDSPAGVDPWRGSVSLIICRHHVARSVVAHVLAHGWGLDSVGRLTRRFSVGWWQVPSNRVKTAPFLSAPVLSARNRVGRGNGNEWAQQATRVSEVPRVQTGSAGRSHAGWKPEPGTTPRRPPLGRNGNGPRRPGALPDVPETNSLVKPDRIMAGLSGHEPDDDLDRTATGWPWSTARSAQNWPSDIAKRCMDVGLACLALVLLSLPLLVVGTLVRLTSRGPALFGHTRQGVGGREFSCLKFRTMVDGANTMQADLRRANEVDGPQFKISSDPRLTRLGAWLRRSNIDELPQLINVLRGDMSLAGPRPSPDNENQYCPGWRQARLSVRPGITGLWQVMRLRRHAATDFQEWIYYDLEYVRHRSLWLDWQLLVHTPLAMLAPGRIGRFAERLKRRGICVDADRLRAQPLG